ncbi:hypothetical protein SAMN04489867_1098 [Pedococcus dokdonensis]|uniref:Uncharacterized protein n=1 Tax=Pedococcus dokdonensis TaxID=443156 RepID=A0A1H0P0U9_9MICO|nr:hypothetical protein SAMN04489867_1098 [Pedococcus dokdonensis]
MKALYVHTIDGGIPASLGFPLTALSLLGSFVATDRILT